MIFTFFEKYLFKKIPLFGSSARNVLTVFETFGTVQGCHKGIPKILKNPEIFINALFAKILDDS